MIHTKQKSHIKGLKSPPKVSLVRSKSTDHLTSAHKSIGRKNILEKATGNDMSATKSSNLAKTKSAKSLKTKTKSTPKSGQTKSGTKTRNKSKKNNQSETKTVKKAKMLIKANLSQESFDSIQSFKLAPLEYFLYQNNYIPIENSAQRRFVFKIKQIDQRNKTCDTFFRKTKTYQIQQQVEQNKKQQVKNVAMQIDRKQISVQTQKTIIVEFGTNTTPRYNNQICVQTQTAKFQQDVEKCFTQTLTDLQFLFLPDEKNFQGFSKPQRLHYRQLFQSIAQKIWSNGQNLDELTEQKVQILLYQRECIQMGMIEFYPEEGFPTHIYALMSYLTNLFSFAEMNEKEEALQKLHSIYGFGYHQRLGRLLKGHPTNKKSSSILSQQLFLSLQKQLFKDHDFGSQTVQKSVHIHNKAIFDAVNQQLEKFKPFYYSKGQPFPWSINIGMTFFSIDQSTIGLLFKQIKEKILMKFGYLCGLLIDYDEFKETSTKEKHQAHIKKLEHHQQKMVQQDIVESNYQAQIQEADASLRTNLSNMILAHLIDELCVDVPAFAQ